MSGYIRFGYIIIVKANMSTTVSALEINGKKLHPIKDATKFVSYSRDYITRLARERKIVATHVGRQWYVDIDSLKNYEQISAKEQELRKQQLSTARKREQEVRSQVEARRSRLAKKEKTFHARAVVATVLVLGFGLVGGMFTNLILSKTSTSIATVAGSVSPKNYSLSLEDATDSFPLAASSEEAPMIPVKSVRDIEPISTDPANGILLLPQGSLTATTGALFSDEVEVLVSESGVEMVVRVDSSGRPVGNVLPFVEVPINQVEI